MEIIKKITNLLHKSDHTEWNKLKKDDLLYLLIPEDYLGITCKYTFQTSKVISIKEYSSICNVRFKYTENGKRKKVNLTINKLKYDQPYVALKKNTQWAREYIPVYGDFVVTSINNEEDINNIYRTLITNKIKEQEDVVLNEKTRLNKLYGLQYDKPINNIKINI